MRYVDTLTWAENLLCVSSRVGNPALVLEASILEFCSLFFPVLLSPWPDAGPASLTPPQPPALLWPQSRSDLLDVHFYHLRLTHTIWLGFCDSSSSEHECAQMVIPRSEKIIKPTVYECECKRMNAQNSKLFFFIFFRTWNSSYTLTTCASRSS